MQTLQLCAENMESLSTCYVCLFVLGDGTEIKRPAVCVCVLCMCVCVCVCVLCTPLRACKRLVTYMCLCLHNVVWFFSTMSTRIYVHLCA